MFVNCDILKASKEAGAFCFTITQRLFCKVPGFLRQELGEQNGRFVTKNMENRPGIYAIVNVVNDNKYIGQAANIGKRWYQHKIQLKSNCHFNQYLQNAYNKYGKANFSFIVLEYCESSLKYLLNEREQYWIDKLNPEYNLIDYVDIEVEYKFFRKNYVINADDVLVVKHWQKYKAPKWNTWVYGSAKNPIHSRTK